MAARKRRVSVPTTVLDRAAELTRLAVKPLAPPPPAKAKLLPREKVVAALKKLHPMD